MNCSDFNDRLSEYLDETLSASEQVSAREHVQKCGICQRVLEKEEAFAKSIRFSLNRETQNLSLHPATRRNILNAVKRLEVSPAAWKKIQTFFAVFWRHLAWTGIALLCLVSLIFANLFYPGSARHSSAQTTVKDSRITYVIDVPIQIGVHVYRRQNNMVIDAVVTGISVIDANFSENIGSSRLEQQHIN